MNEDLIVNIESINPTKKSLSKSPSIKP